ncbi:hypothetical protein DXA15_22935 [Parabacteroides sp. AM58-2XD]|uniref:hypothetical protein n=1 Tax=Parabacteroides TaxID=375288 RepID=UPI000FE1EEAB|nr:MULTISPECIES: hypothetical protein [Parabacteroides]MCM0722279.1 hypothetical protein [Parabacteroides sp. W1-Q-101]RGY91990.1 hypothetical protein DXA15_22935 [Parabacteroides sp. AM58-2XD]GKG74100.1 hypothetical protein CE91St1_32430 [Parabacteroides goldsteinii]GKG82493.1 hypothetical protein CE91St2_56850 [Parabacteroides goldsteinii]
MNVKLVKTLAFIFVCTGIISFFVFWFMNVYEKQNKKLHTTASILFIDAIQQDASQAIKRFKGFHDPLNSPNDISGDEKIAQCIQDYRITHDPSRHILDSLFQSLLKEQGIPVKVAIRCIWKGKVIDTSADSSLYKDATLLKSIVYRLSEKKNDAITLQAYADFPVGMILGRMGWFWCISFLILVGLVGGGWYFNRQNLIKRQQSKSIERLQAELVELKVRKQEIEKINKQQVESIEQKQAELIKLETKQRNTEKVNKQQSESIEQLQAELVELNDQKQETDAINKQQAELIGQKQFELEKLLKWIVPLSSNEKIIWIELPCGFYFSKKYGVLRNANGMAIQLKNNSLSLFRHFVEVEDHMLTYKYICTDVLERFVKDEIGDSDRDCVSAAIKRLREDVEPFSCIEFKSIRKTGYQMTFSNYQNDTTQPGKSD